MKSKLKKPSIIRQRRGESYGESWYRFRCRLAAYADAKCMQTCAEFSGKPKQKRLLKAFYGLPVVELLNAGGYRNTALLVPEEKHF